MVHQRRSSQVQVENEQEMEVEFDEKFSKSIYMMTNNVRVNVIKKNNKTLCQLNIESLFANILVSDQKSIYTGSIHRINLFDLNTLQERHSLFGCVLEDQKQKEDKNYTIFSTRNRVEQPMIEFSWNHYSNKYPKIKDHHYDIIIVKVYFSYIDYIYASYYNFMKYLEDEYSNIHVFH